MHPAQGRRRLIKPRCVQYPRGGGFSVDAGVCIAGADRARLERLLRYCARPLFAMERLRQHGADLVYHCPKPQAGGKRAMAL